MKEIQLSNGDIATVDDEDYEKISSLKWHPHHHGSTVYALANKSRQNGAKPVTIRMHRLIMDAPKEMVVDHINGNGLDNRRCNLRVCTQKQNMGNSKNRVGTSRYKGVCWHKGGACWHAQINNGGVKFLGCFQTEETAAEAYNAAAKVAWGAFARLNEIPPQAVSVDTAASPVV